jgi:hypothetical protein
METWESCGPIIDLYKPSPKITAKPAYKGTVRNRMFSLAGRFLLIQILGDELNIFKNVEVFR